MKAGEARQCALNAAALAAKDKPLEARLFGYSVLHCLVKSGWAEYGQHEREQLAQLALGMVGETAGGTSETWAIKCKCSALLAEVLRQVRGREG